VLLQQFRVSMIKACNAIFNNLRTPDPKPQAPRPQGASVDRIQYLHSLPCAFRTCVRSSGLSKLASAVKPPYRAMSAVEMTCTQQYKQHTGASSTGSTSDTRQSMWMSGTKAQAVQTLEAKVNSPVKHAVRGIHSPAVLLDAGTAGQQGGKVMECSAGARMHADAALKEHTLAVVQQLPVPKADTYALTHSSRTRACCHTHVAVVGAEVWADRHECACSCLVAPAVQVRHACCCLQLCLRHRLSLQTHMRTQTLDPSVCIPHPILL
jgi:hypothetical protein